MSAVPRRANKVRELAASMGAQMTQETLALVDARQAVSNRIGYALAMVLGATVSGFLGWWAVLVLGVFYAFGAWGAYRRWKKLTR